VSGRRSYERFHVESPWTASVRVTRDVWIKQNGGGELVVISRTPARVDERLTLTLSGRAGIIDLTLEVVESVPVIVDGAVRHQLTLRALQSAEDAHG
jgi:hypothetical protein